jgi:murein L,D-transpeptidase YcbB/YkuD
MRQNLEVDISGTSIAMYNIIAEYYEHRNFSPAWNQQQDISDLLQLIDESKLEGLIPEDYHKSALLRYQNVIESFDNVPPKLKAEFDLILTDALLRLVYHMVFGKVDPVRLDPNWNIYIEVNDIDPPALVDKIISAPSLYKYIDSHRTKARLYTELTKHLARYRDIAASGGWPQISEGPVIKPGMQNQRIVQIRSRLLVTADLKDTTITDSTLYNENLERSIRRFQYRHGLEEDGIIGKGTLATLNIPVEDKIDQIRVNLERLRWILDEGSDEFILVNIAGFRVNLASEYNLIWHGRAQVGKLYRQTPIFKAPLKYLVINPTWTVPPTILAKDVIPAIKRDQSYLQKKNMKIISRSGKIVDPGSIDWSQYPAKNFPYSIRQDPGPTNALGRIKFIFPNKHFVFLHDTPSKALFNRTERTFSSGCIRVEDPFEFALQLLRNQDDWNREKIDEILKSKKTKTIYLKEQIPVYLLYFTAFPDIGREDIIHFRKDIYKRDNKVLTNLNSGFRFFQKHKK